ncbi:hypothetical protein LCGC14_1989150 [marine sediment metagenome]|uniref:Uncharacterized protein n=1 Tax=marine sediment metagenome TaxID=412755 RepID=A0A0F9F6T3_9ZZZZ|nr:hypothetical protein [Desulfobacterales bacterium]
MNIQDFSQIYRRKVRGVSDGSSTIRLKLGRVGPKKLRVLTHVTVEDRTTSFTKCRLGTSNGAIDFYLDELTTLAAAELAVSRSDILLGESDVFFAELTGTTSGDDLVMNCIGWELKI